MDAGGNVLQTFAYRKDFAVRPGSGSAEFSTEVVFVGYGITALDFGYDDYANVVSQGRVVLAIVGTPPSERFRQSSYGAWNSKADNALRYGAIGLILIDNPVEPIPFYVERSTGGQTFYQKLVVLGGPSRWLIPCLGSAARRCLRFKD
ncbi:hypothetical protein MUP05_00815 [Candidatus Bathyarchaeota archaeon]|nr:hypothetical protein [Candidatus Bathyarchaeota archaeon]